MRWDVVQPAVGGILHGRGTAGPEVAYSDIVTGTAHPSIRAGAIASFTADDKQNAESVMGGLKVAGLQVAAWLDDCSLPPPLLRYRADPRPRISPRAPKRPWVSGTIGRLKTAWPGSLPRSADHRCARSCRELCASKCGCRCGAGGGPFARTTATYDGRR